MIEGRPIMESVCAPRHHPLELPRLRSASLPLSRSCEASGYAQAGKPHLSPGEPFGYASSAVARETAARSDPNYAAQPRALAGSVISGQGAPCSASSSEAMGHPEFSDHSPVRMPAGDTAGSPPADPLPPGAPAANLPGLGPGGSLASILAARLEQVEKWGHTPAKDRERPIAPFLDHMLHEIQRYAIAALDDHRARNGLGQIRKRLVRVAALILATIDRIDAEPAPEGEDTF